MKSATHKFTQEEVKKIAKALADNGEVYIGGLGTIKRNFFRRRIYNFVAKKMVDIKSSRIALKPSETFKREVKGVDKSVAINR